MDKYRSSQSHHLFSMENRKKNWVYAKTYFFLISVNCWIDCKDAVRWETFWCSRPSVYYCFNLARSCRTQPGGRKLFLHVIKLMCCYFDSLKEWIPRLAPHCLQFVSIKWTLEWEWCNNAAVGFCLEISSLKAETLRLRLASFTLIKPAYYHLHHPKTNKIVDG